MIYSIFLSMIYKHIIWDWNGTLLDDREICVKSINQILLNRELPLITLENYMSLFTFPVKNFYEKLGLDFKKNSFSKVGDEFIQFYSTHFKILKLHSNTSKVLNKVKDIGITQSILSAAMQGMLDKWVMDHSLTEFFIKIMGVDNQYAHGKIKIGEKHISDLKFDKKEILMIGDTVHDSEVAEQIKIDCILIDHGHVSRTRLKKTGRDVFSNFMEIFEYLTKF